MIDYDEDLAAYKKYEYSLTVVPGQWVQFSDLPHIMAIAMHPDGEMAYGATRLNLENELTQAVSDGLLTVRNRYGLGIHTLPHGDALQKAVLIPKDLEPFLNAREFELRITLHGSGPDYQTPENIATTTADSQDQRQKGTATGPRLFTTRAALITQHKHEWPTIEMADDSEPCDTDICPACNGSGEGQHEDTRCYHCKGKGEV